MRLKKFSYYFLFISLTSERPMWRWLPYWTGQVQTLVPPHRPSPPAHSCTLTSRKRAAPCTLLLRLLLGLASRPVRLFSVFSGLHPEAFSSMCSLWIILYSAKPVFCSKVGKDFVVFKKWPKYWFVSERRGRRNQPTSAHFGSLPNLRDGQDRTPLQTVYAGGFYRLPVMFSLSLK